MKDDASIPASKSTARNATIALLIATLFWGCGFTWAKSGGEAVNAAAGLKHGSPLGPIWLLCVRFGIAGLLWLVIFPAARRGWNRMSVARAALSGTTLAAGLITQHLGLDRSSEAVTAFLTSLTILFVPLLMMIVFRRPPPAVLWIGIVLATVGVWLMTGAASGTFGVGEALALGCAVLFSLHLISINLVMKHDVPARMAPGQFFAVAIVSGVVCLFLNRGPQSLMPGRALELIVMPGIGNNLLWMILFVTIGAFGLQTTFQPHLDPTRAALLYLMEPVFASIFAYLTMSRSLNRSGMAGAALILVANAVVEVLQSRRSRNPSQFDAGSGPAIVD